MKGSNLSVKYFYNVGELGRYLEKFAEEYGFGSKEYLKVLSEFFQHFPMRSEVQTFSFEDSFVILHPEIDHSIRFRAPLALPIFGLKLKWSSGKGEFLLGKREISFSFPKKWGEVFRKRLESYGKKFPFSPSDEGLFFQLYEILVRETSNLGFYSFEDYPRFVEDLDLFLESYWPEIRPFFQHWVEYLTSFFTEVFVIEGHNLVPLYRLFPTGQPDYLYIFGFSPVRSLLVYDVSDSEADFSLYGFEVGVTF